MGVITAADSAYFLPFPATSYPGTTKEEELLSIPSESSINTSCDAEQIWYAKETYYFEEQ